MASKITKSDLIRAYRKIDLYRAKYPHADLTPYGWCFHGNESQQWSGQGLEHRLLIENGETTSAISLNTDSYRYFSMSIDIPQFTKSSTVSYGQALDIVDVVIKDYKTRITMSDDLTNEYVYERDLKIGNNIVYFDTSIIGTLVSIKIEILYFHEDIWTKYIENSSRIEYVKFDHKNIFKEVEDNEKTITENDINYLRELIDEVNKSQIDWNKPGSLDDRVKKFLSVIKKDDFVKIKEVINSIEPYNGCSECDSFTCSCYSEAYGHVPCQTCDGCNAYVACSLACDQGCYSEAVLCTCDMECDAEGTSCECNARCYRDRCTCDYEFYVTASGCSY